MESIAEKKQGSETDDDSIAPLPVELRQSPPSPAASYLIILNGVEVGTVERATSPGQWHAVIELGLSTRLAQGFGRNPNSAILNAIQRGRDERAAMAIELQKIEQSLGTSLLPRSELDNRFNFYDDPDAAETAPAGDSKLSATPGLLEKLPEPHGAVCDSTEIERVEFDRKNVPDPYDGGRLS